MIRVRKLKVLSRALLSAALSMAALLPMQQGFAAEIDRLTIASGTFPVSFDPSKDVGIPSIVVNSNIYDSLLTRDKDLHIIGSLAESWRRVDDTTWEFKLRKGVTFQNGEPFNAESAKYSLDRVLDPAEKSAQRGWINTVASVSVVDPLTLRVTTSSPDPALPARLTLMYMVPEAYTKKVGSAGLAANPVGTGPFKIGQWVRGDYVDLDANSTYWGPKPKIEHARFRAIPDGAARIAALKSKSAQIITDLPPDYVAPIKATPGLEVKPVLSSRIIFIGLYNTKPGPLQDVRVRQAMNYAVNVDAIIKSLLLGNGQRTGDVNGHLLRLLGNPYKSKLYSYDPKKAKQLLTEAGFPNGFSIDLDTPSGRYLGDRDMAQVVASQLGAVGIKVNVHVNEWGAYSQKFTTHNTAPMFLLGWSLPSLDPDSWATPMLGAGEPLSNFKDDKIQSLIVAANHELDDKKRIALYEQLDDQIHDAAPWLFLNQQVNIYGMSSAINWTPRPDEMIHLSDMSMR
jgi:peptide/nickel transport system substrate-binding protein